MVPNPVLKKMPKKNIANLKRPLDGENSSNKSDDVKKRKVENLAMRKRLFAESDFIANLVGQIYIPKHKPQFSEDLDSSDEEEQSESKMKNSSFGNCTRARSVEDLQNRLQKKLEEFKGNRPDRGNKNPKLTKVEKKQKAKEEKKLKKQLLKASKNVDEWKNSVQGGKKLSNNPKKPGVNSKGKIVFSKFDFTEDKTSEDRDSKNIDPKSALKKLKKHKEKIKSLETIGKTERVKNIEDKAAWKAALDKAQGVKVKDDEALLKKSIKKLEQRKKSSKKKWEERNTNVEKRKEMKQNKRKENIDKRKDQNKQKKMKKAMKKGRLIPGFQ